MKSKTLNADLPNKENSVSTLKNSHFPIVGIGASAGGLEALELFFENLPKDNGMAFVVIQHLDPNHVGIMPELLQRVTSMKVLQASERLKVKPNYVYVIPPNKSLTLLNGSLFLLDPVEARGLRLPIDIFFRSLAEEMKEKSIGIILSGMGSDGSLGVKTIKENHGIVLVQEPESAKFDGMPRSALDAVDVDIVAPPEKLPEMLINFLHRPGNLHVNHENDPKNKSNLDKIISLLHDRTGNDFSQYKKNTLFRRVERRKMLNQIDKIQDYVHFLEDNPDEIQILFKELLIGVTSFFRDPALWEKLKDEILPELFTSLSDKYTLRAWIPGCSTGEEAYSMAIIFRESIEKFKNYKNLSLQIFATDLDIEAIEIARKGFYPKHIAEEVSQERLNRFFEVDNNGYRINTTIRDMIVFAPQNVIKDPPFTKLDILSCRNMLIYMESKLQKKLVRLFNYSLNQWGIMFLGTAETIGNNNEGFEELDAKLKIYKRTSALNSTEFDDVPSSFYSATKAPEEKKIISKSIENIQSLATQFLLKNYAPPSVLVNNKGDIIFITGRIGKYLEPAAGLANWNIHVMAHEGMQQILAGAFYRALHSFDPIILQNVKIENKTETFIVDITLQRLENPDLIKGMVLVVFDDVKNLPETEPIHTGNYKHKSTGRIKELEIELQKSFEDMQSMREMMQTSQEELKSTNEELQSTNEELQSTNEELTTSKEEMQSLNEELQTVNTELQSKINDFIRTNDDMKNLLNSTEIATLFLDKELNIRRYTDKVVNIFKLRIADIGRPITDLVTDLNYPDIESNARQVNKTLVSIEKHVKTWDDRWFSIRIMPYRTLDDKIDGLVMTFTDITSFKNLENELKKANEVLVNNSKI